VLGTGWFGAVAADVQLGMTVAVVGDGAVGLLAILAARQLGAERIIAISRHEPRQRLALEFGATDIVTECGDEGVARVRELTGGYGAHSVGAVAGCPRRNMTCMEYFFDVILIAWISTGRRSSGGGWTGSRSRRARGTSGPAHPDVHRPRPGPVAETDRPANRRQ
jgi:threonine dehydrogenase-like Zn-dependent dehydrogenase